MIEKVRLGRDVRWRKWGLWLTTVVVLTIPILIVAYPDQPPARHAGAPGDAGTCTTCHSQASGATGNVQITFPGGMTYTPGVTQHLTVTITDSTAARWGFEATARLASDLSNGQAGTWDSVDANTQVICEDDSVRPASGACPTTAPVEFIEQTLSGTHAGTAGPITYNVDWTPPATAAGDVHFYIAGMGANNNGGSSGDHTYAANYTITAATPPPPPPPSAPTVTSFSPTSGPEGTAFVVTGTNFTGATAVALNGTAANFTVASGTTINTSVPTGATTGPISVTTPAGTGTSTSDFTVTTPPPPAAATLTVSPSSLRFVAGAPSKTVQVTASEGSIPFSAAASTTSGGNWLIIDPTSGSATTSGTTLTISLDPTVVSGLTRARYFGVVTITPTDNSISPVTVSVTLRVGHRKGGAAGASQEGESETE